MITQTHFPFQSINSKKSTWGLIVLLGGVILAGALMTINYMNNLKNSSNVAG